MTHYAVMVPEPNEPAPAGEAALTHEDVRGINQRLAQLHAEWGGLRVHVGEFRIPWPLTKRQYEDARKQAVDRWLHWMEQEGWDLKSKVHVKGLRPAYDYHGDWQGVPLLDQRFVRVLAAFQVQKLASRGFEVPVRRE